MTVYNSGSEQLSIQIRAVCIPESSSVISKIAVRYLLSLGGITVSVYSKESLVWILGDY